MAERPSGYEPEQPPESQNLPQEDDAGDIEAAFQRLSPTELARIRLAAAAVAADMESGPQSWSAPPSPEADIPFEEIPVPGVDKIEEQVPIWGIEPLDTQLLPNEAPSLRQREHARQYYFILTSLAEQRYQYEATLPAPEELLEAYTAYYEIVDLENRELPSAERLPAFTPEHLWAAARRQNSWVAQWLEEQHGDVVPEEFYEAVLIGDHIEQGLAEALRLLKSDLSIVSA